MVTKLSKTIQEVLETKQSNFGANVLTVVTEKVDDIGVLIGLLLKWDYRKYWTTTFQGIGNNEI